MDEIARRTGWAPLGIVPWFEEAWRLPAEDILDIKGRPGDGLVAIEEVGFNALDASPASNDSLTTRFRFCKKAARRSSGSGAMGVMTETMQAHGPDSMIGYMVSTISGSMRSSEL